MSEKVYKWDFDCGRMGSLDGLFVADEQDVAAAIGKDVYFGEVLGKHSEVYGVLEASEFTPLSSNDAVIQFVKEHGPFGFNPLAYVRQPCDGCETGMSLDEEQTYWCHECEEHLCYHCAETEHGDCPPVVEFEKRAVKPQ